MQWDSEIGQDYVWHRHYLAGPGRFESEDALGFAAGDSNLYRYVMNSPIGSADPSGSYAENTDPRKLECLRLQAELDRLRAEVVQIVVAMVGIGFAQAQARAISPIAMTDEQFEMQVTAVLRPYMKQLGIIQAWIKVVQREMRRLKCRER